MATGVSAARSGGAGIAPLEGSGAWAFSSLPKAPRRGDAADSGCLDLFAHRPYNAHREGHIQLGSASHATVSLAFPGRGAKADSRCPSTPPQGKGRVRMDGSTISLKRW